MSAFGNEDCSAPHRDGLHAVVIAVQALVVIVLLSASSLSAETPGGHSGQLAAHTERSPNALRATQIRVLPNTAMNRERLNAPGAEDQQDEGQASTVDCEDTRKVWDAEERGNTAYCHGDMKGAAAEYAKGLKLSRACTGTA